MCVKWIYEVFSKFNLWFIKLFIFSLFYILVIFSYKNDYFWFGKLVLLFDGKIFFLLMILEEI